MGQLAQAAKNPNTYAPQPSGFNASEWATRFGAAGLKGLGQDLQNYDQQNANQRLNAAIGGTMQPAQGAQPVDSSYFLPQQSRKPNSLFYGYGS